MTPRQMLGQGERSVSMMTNIYHIYYAPETKEVSLMFWGCNINCRGCYCKRRIYSPMLKDFIGTHIHDDPGLAKPPEQFLIHNTPD